MYYYNPYHACLYKKIDNKLYAFWYNGVSKGPVWVEAELDYTKPEYVEPTTIQDFIRTLYNKKHTKDSGYVSELYSLIKQDFYKELLENT